MKEREFSMLILSLTKHYEKINWIEKWEEISRLLYEFGVYINSVSFRTISDRKIYSFYIKRRDSKEKFLRELNARRDDIGIIDLDFFEKNTHEYSGISLSSENYYITGYITIRTVLNCGSYLNQKWNSKEKFSLFKLYISELQNCGFEIIASNSYFFPARLHPDCIIKGIFVELRDGYKDAYQHSSYINKVIKSNSSYRKPTLFLLSNFNAIKYSSPALEVLQESLAEDAVFLDSSSEIIFFELGDDEHYSIIELMKTELYKNLYNKLVKMNLLNEYYEAK
ncbi:MAG: hypothetical protein LBT59_24465 [Clostridiales bacterium]|jgi:hypothetical protein|nr:hypothetical protein [Clostridiales bacterium]